MSVAGTASAAVIADENFEGGASGWSNNLTTVGNASFTEFLGRFDGSAGTVSKTFALSGTQTQATISFNFYEIDSWDNEQFRVYVDDVLIAANAYSLATREDPGAIAGGSISTVLPVSGNANLGFSPSFPDQTYLYSFTVATTGTTLKLAFDSTLNQDFTDEAWGVDNVHIETNAGAASVPEPGSLAMLGLGLAGLGLIRRRRGSR